VLAVLAVLGGLLVAFTGDSPAKNRRDDVTQQAERFALALSSYNYRTIDRDLAHVKAMGVGNFRYQYTQVLGGDAFRKALSTNQAVATAKVVKGPYLASLSDDDARTFTVLEQSLRGKGQTQPQTRRVRVESILVRTADGWRVDWVEIT
jgi:Mce-associated membrane protein